MVLREDTAAVRTAGRYGRHGRPKPVGGRFRLPGFRFSGAAMAMSTVVGISIATTWLLEEQQSVGRQPEVSNVGASPPLPSPEGSVLPTLAPPAAVPAGPLGTPGVRALGTRTARPVTAGTPGTPAGSAAPGAVGPGAADSVSPRPTQSTGPSQPPPAGAGPVKVTPAPITPPGGPTTKPPGVPQDEPLAGEGTREQFGPSGTRHTLVLDVGEAVTALQVELRLDRPETLPGTIPWSNLPGAVATVVQDRDTLIYRFTFPAGLDVRPGKYVFGVRGACPPVRSRLRTSQESWVASAFALRDPRALAVRGTFDGAPETD